MEQKLTRLIRSRESHTPPGERQIEEYYTQLVDDLASWFEKARLSEDSSMYSALHGQVDEMRDDLRESAQALTREQMFRIIQNLRTGAAMSDDDFQLVRMWLVGDAVFYTKLENNFGDWLDEMARLESEIRRLRSGPVDPTNLKILHALLTDARGVILNITNFLAERARVEHFNETMRGEFTEQRRTLLADILLQSYDSPTR